VINIRKLVALDMLLHGTRFILAEFAFGILCPIVIFIVFLRAKSLDVVQPLWVILLGYWLVGLAVNYIPLFIYAVIIAGNGSVAEEAQPERANVLKYSLQQFIIFIPLLVAVVALLQESRRYR